MKLALISLLLFALVVHAERPVAPSQNDGSKVAAESSIRIEKPDGTLVVTGVLVTSDGYFLTKASEVPKLESFSYRLPDKAVVKAREVRRNSRFDLVLGQLVNITGALPVKWSESKSMSLGQWLLAPEQGGRGARLGVMSAHRREIKGGSAAIGIMMDEKNAADGVKIIGIAEDSPAAAAGLKADDVLVSIAGDSIKEFKAVHNLIVNREPGDELEIQYRRGDKVTKCTVRLASRSRIRANWDGEDYANGGISIRTDNFQEVLQHDIPLGPGDMGGPLCNLLGQAVGINIARVDRVTTFALPMEIFWPSVQQWIAEDQHPPKAEPTASVAKPDSKL